MHMDENEEHGLKKSASLPVKGGDADLSAANYYRNAVTEGPQVGRAPLRHIVKSSLRHIVKSSRRFDMTQHPEDLQRVYGHLKRRFGEEYALHIVFTIRTAVELHRAWHMTLLTSKLMQQLKEKFKLRTTWTLGVLRLKFRIEDGDYELHRKVPRESGQETGASI